MVAWTGGKWEAGVKTAGSSCMPRCAHPHPHRVRSLPCEVAVARGVCLAERPMGTQC